ncbi:MAG: Holliday junction resolvase RuvX [Coriobacteriia bacterium]|nr:Holliday junction resolvase RuvX [Coriobacteriia bacterium]
MRVIALDIGRVRVGIAVSDAAGSIALPLKVLPSNEVKTNAASFRRILEDYEPELIVCGLPMSLSGEANQQAQDVKAFAELVSQNTHIPIEYVDERLSSKEAKAILHKQGLSEKAMRGKVDMVAASLFLQAWLDAKSE